MASKKLGPRVTEWTVLERLHPGHRFLGCDPLYALRPDVIDAVRRRVPGFFTEEDERFERNLHACGGAGFYRQGRLGRPFALVYEQELSSNELHVRQLMKIENPKPYLSPAGNEPRIFATGHTPAWVSAALNALREQKKKFELTESEYANYAEQRRKAERLTLHRAEAYAGWLILNRDFQAELAGLRSRRGAAVERWGGFPMAGRRFRPARALSAPIACGKAWSAFYRRWGLSRMLTWEFPVPSDLVLDNPSRATPAVDGVHLFLPWYQLRGDQLDLRQVAQRIRAESVPRHLRDWVCKSPRQSDQGGDITYRRLFNLYRWYELVLLRRYPEACSGRVEKLDVALGRVLELGPDWVKRLRQRLARELGALRATGAAEAEAPPERE
jgi:hypothetical protein